MLELERDGNRYKLCEADLARYRSMREILSELHTHQRALGDLNSPHQRSDRKAEMSSRSRRRRGGKNRKG
jgi:hypothetical protein